MCECKNKIIMNLRAGIGIPLNRVMYFHFTLYEDKFEICAREEDYGDITFFTSENYIKLEEIFQKIMECIIQCDTPVIHQEYLDQYLNEHL